MLMKYCPINKIVNKDKNCSSCFNNNYYLIDRNNKKYRIYTEPFNNHLTHLMNYKKLNIIEDTLKYYDLGINNFRIELLDETDNEIIGLYKELKNKLNKK